MTKWFSERCGGKGGESLSLERKFCVWKFYNKGGKEEGEKFKFFMDVIYDRSLESLVEFNPVLMSSQKFKFNFLRSKTFNIINSQTNIVNSSQFLHTIQLKIQRNY